MRMVTELEPSQMKTTLNDTAVKADGSTFIAWLKPRFEERL
jgi:hypothetical protein